MMDFKTALGTTLLIVDDDVQQLELRALVLKMSGFTVLTAVGPIEAIALMAQHSIRRVDVAILDYNMPVMNGCVLADYMRTCYPELKIILHSGAVDIPGSEMGNIDAFVAKTDGLARLLDEVLLLAQLRSAPSSAVIASEASLSAARAASE